MDILVSIYVIYQKNLIFALKNVIIMARVKENAINYVIFHMDIKESVFAKSHMIIFVMENVHFMENQGDAIENAH